MSSLRWSLLYSTVRLLIFVACFAGLALVPGLNDNPVAVLLGGAVLSLVVSYVALGRLRERMSDELSGVVARKMESRRARAGRDRGDEDGDDGTKDHAG